MVVISALLAASALEAQTRDRARIAAAVDSMVAAALKTGRVPGMAVAVVRGRDTIVMKGYGLADLEFDVPTPVRGIYEIGSVTKQFTSAAILQLQEQGKLSLDDELTKYLPSYPVNGRRITIRRLMDHSSGIKGYTEMPEFGTFMMRDLPRDSLVALFSSRPFDFEPGDAVVYNNSAYFLLGLIIEKVSGQTYEDYVQKNLFERAGMRDSRYCSERAIVKNRVHGYDNSPTGLVRAAYLDHNWPYSAGSLCSTVGDLIAWNYALHGGRILTPASYRSMITGEKLNDGAIIRYAKGLMVDSSFGHRVISHGGGINGFVSQLDYYPDDSLHIVVLVNSTAPPGAGAISNGIARTIFGPWSRKAVAFTGNAQEYAGEYRGVGRGQDIILTIAPTADGKGLTVRNRTANPATMLYLGGETFEVGATRFTFVRENGKITKLRRDGGAAYTVLTRAMN